MTHVIQPCDNESLSNRPITIYPMKTLKLSQIAEHVQFLERYIVREDGQVMSRRDQFTGMVQRPHPNGFLFVDLSDGRGGFWRSWVHILVALQHVKRERSKLHGLKVRHLNERTHDNRAANLEWVDIAAHSLHGRICPTCGQGMPLLGAGAEPASKEWPIAPDA